MEKDISSHAEPDRPTLSNPKMIEQGQGVPSTLSMRNLLAGVGRSTVTACIGHDERIFTHELVATGMRPIIVAAGAAMKKQERLSRALPLVIHFDVAELDRFVLHDAAIMAAGGETNNLGNARDRI